MLREYEGMLILPAEADEALVGTAVDRIAKTIAPTGGKVDSIDRWGRRRFAYEIEDYKITEDGKCPGCGFLVPGRWAGHFDGQISVRPFLPRRASSLVTIANRR